MVVENRRRKVVASGRPGNHPSHNPVNIQGSQFSVLDKTVHVGSPNHMVDNAAMEGHNEGVIDVDVVERHADIGKRVTKNATYIASNPKKKLKNKGGDGNQSTVISLVSVCGRKRTGNILKGGLGVSGNSVKSRRAVEYRRASMAGTSTFINNMNGELDRIIEALGDGGTAIHMLSDDDSSWTDFQLDDEGDPGGHIPARDHGNK
ncbi:hypothetical protein V6N13_014086 [Hibiscus sabdariffa]|uniref:Uncharacterized protein n=1 Tax=Hibiscus sabdariffa TaxID=183260 RepID=A0ABR2RUD5_9ROSI